MKLSQAFVQKLDKIFNDAAGAELNAAPRTQTLDGRPYVELVPEKGDPVAARLRFLSGQDVCFILADADRDTGARAAYPALTSFVEEDENGKYRITPNWNLGVK